MILVAQGVHRLPEAEVPIGAQLIVLGEPSQRLMLEHGRVTVDVIEYLGTEHEEPAVDRRIRVGWLFGERANPIAVQFERAKSTGWNDGGDCAGAAVPFVKCNA